MSTPKWMVEAIATELEGTKHHGWTCTWEHPGFFEFSHPDHEHRVAVAIDHDAPGEISFESHNDEHDVLTTRVVVYQAPLQTGAFVNVVRQFLLTDPSEWSGDDPDECDPTSLETVR